MRPNVCGTRTSGISSPNSPTLRRQALLKSCTHTNRRAFTRQPRDRAAERIGATHRHEEEIRERRRLERQLRQVEARYRESIRIMSSQEEARRRLARDLHDGLGQSLTAVLIGLCALDDLVTSQVARAHTSALRKIAATAIDEVRHLAGGLRAPILNAGGLAAALQHFAAGYAQTYGTAVHVEAADINEQRLPPAVETALYRIVQEAVTNTAKYAAAQTVRIAVQRQYGRVHLRVQDDGCGFDVDMMLGTQESREHFGLCHMRERVALLNGSLKIESRKGAGTTVSVSIPLSEENDGQDPRTDRR